MVGAYHPTRPCASRLLGFETLKDLEFRNREGEFKQETSLALSRRSRRGSRRFCPSGMHSRKSSSPAREFECAQIDPDASEAPVSSMTYGKAALCRLLTLVVDVVVYGVVCVRIGRGDAAVAPPRIRQYRAGWLPFSLHAKWAWAQRRLFISALAKTSCLSEGFKSQLRKERKESHMQ